MRRSIIEVTITLGGAVHVLWLNKLRHLVCGKVYEHVLGPASESVSPLVCRDYETNIGFGSSYEWV